VLKNPNKKIRFGRELKTNRNGEAPPTRIEKTSHGDEMMLFFVFLHQFRSPSR